LQTVAPFELKKAVARREQCKMRFFINVLTTYFPDADPPYDVYYRQILEQVELAEELGWECFMFNEPHFLGYGGLVANPAVLLAAAAARAKTIGNGCVKPSR
jgi:alkanesulfonate monooxygenase SsuD/methylene tetrahydromethanopterin reductase-like flavin-dependent oxidoreductase (luciferase family)